MCNWSLWCKVAGKPSNTFNSIAVASAVSTWQQNREMSALAYQISTIFFQSNFTDAWVVLFVVFTSGNATSGDRMVPVLLRTVLSSCLFLVLLMKSFSSGVFCYITRSKYNTFQCLNDFIFSSIQSCSMESTKNTVFCLLTITLKNCTVSEL